jgi:hypothetical protein
VSQAVAVVVTLVAATAFALSSVAEQRSTKQVPRRGVLAPRLLLDLLSRPLWLVAIALNAVGSVLQVVALHFGACAAGIAGFLAAGSPSGRRETASFVAVLPLFALLGATLGGCLAVLRWGPRKLRALVLAFATGVDFGVTAFLLKLVSHALAHGFSDPARLWPLYAVAITGPLRNFPARRRPWPLRCCRSP